MGKIPKEYKKYICLCGRDFGNRKDNYETHLNKKFPCSGIALITNTPNTPNTLTITENLDNNKLLCVEINTDTKEIKSYPCEYCNKVFTRKYSLDRHLDERCKLKLDIDIKQNVRLEDFEDKLNHVIKENQELKNQIVQLIFKIDETKKIHQSIKSWKLPFQQIQI